LMRDLVRERVADEGDVCVGLERAEDVLHDRGAVRLLEVATLLDVGVLVDHAALLRREVGRSPRWEVVRDVRLERVLTREMRQRRTPGRAAMSGRSRDRGRVQLEIREV